MTKQKEDISEELEEATTAEATAASTEESATAEAQAAAEPELSELEKAQNEAAEMKVRYLRAVADLEN